LSSGAGASFGAFGAGVFGGFGGVGTAASAILGAGADSFALRFTDTSPESVFTVICDPPLPILPLIDEFP
jgi:hypothetical protein